MLAAVRQAMHGDGMRHRIYGSELEAGIEING